MNFENFKSNSLQKCNVSFHGHAPKLIPQFPMFKLNFRQALIEEKDVESQALDSESEDEVNQHPFLTVKELKTYYLSGRYNDKSSARSNKMLTEEMCLGKIKDYVRSVGSWCWNAAERHSSTSYWDFVFFFFSNKYQNNQGIQILPLQIAYSKVQDVIQYSV